MKIIKILLSFIFCVLPLTEALGEGFVTIDFGTSKKEATEHFITMWGQPDIVNDEAIVFLNKDYRGFRFNKIIIGFENKSDDHHFNQARFFIARHTRHHAVVQRDSIARIMAHKYGYGISTDYEENGNKFYKGGTSPEGIGFLFTIYTQRREGRWMTELRFGAFHKIKK